MKTISRRIRELSEQLMQEHENRSFTAEVASLLRFSLAWMNEGSQDSKTAAEYERELQIDSWLREELGFSGIPVESDDIVYSDQVIGNLLEHFSKFGPNWKFIPYALKGVSGRSGVERVMVDFFSRHWEACSDIASQVLMTHISIESSQTISSMLKYVAENSSNADLRRSASQRLSVLKEAEGDG